MSLGFKLLLPLLITRTLLAGSLSLVEQRLEHFIKKQIPESQKITIEKIHCRQLPVSRPEIALLSPQHPLGFVSFEVRWRMGGELQKSLCSAEVRVEAKVAVSQTLIRNGEPLSDADIRFEPKELSNLVQSGYYTQSNQLLPLSANGNIMPHTVIGFIHTQAQKAIHVGEWVDLLLEKGSLVIRAKVKALESGQVKSWIRVENPSTQKILVAQVVRPGEVKIR